MVNKIKTTDGKVFKYLIDSASNAFGYGIGDMPITEKIDSVLVPITEQDIRNISVTSREAEDLDCCNLNLDLLVGKYFDKDGFVYYNTDDTIYRFCLRLKSLGKNYPQHLHENKSEWEPVR
jgi:hypothetical protein